MTKLEAEHCRDLSIYWLKKYGYLNTSKIGGITWTRGENKNSIGFTSHIDNEGSHIQILYTVTEKDGNKKDFDYRIELTKTQCNYGGSRYWFLCPLSGCRKRVGVLYKPFYNYYFGCRHCFNLTYLSRNLGGIEKAFGGITSIPKLEKMEGEIKRKYYRGQPTRKYRVYLKKCRSNEMIVGVKTARTDRILQRFGIRR